MPDQLLNHLDLTPGLRRAILHAALAEQGPLSAPALLTGLLLEEESRAAAMLNRAGVSIEVVQKRWPELTLAKNAATAPNAADVTMPKILPELQTVFKTAQNWTANHHLPTELATEHILLGLLCEEATTDVGTWLREQGLSEAAISDEILHLFGMTASEVAIADWEDADESLPDAESSAAPSRPALDSLDLPDEPTGLDRPGLPDEVCDIIPVLRAFDASANRAREALRVVEDYVRFVLDDPHLTEQLKILRHELTVAVESIPVSARLVARDTPSDVGTQITTPTEQDRADAGALLAANFSRLQEALRSLEEFGKLLDSATAARLEQARYRAYTLHGAVENTRRSLDRLLESRLYVLLDGRPSPEAFETIATTLIRANVDLIQLRDKQLDDRELLRRARILRRLTDGTPTRFIMNDRPDLARLADADGVHLGQEELTVKDARRIVGPEMLIGVSTHTIEQAREAVLDGADYIGVGPTFPSETKKFETFAGLELLKAVAAEIRLPSFAIGGIDKTNLSQVLATGIRRIAVSGCVLDAEAPSEMVLHLQDTLIGSVS
ncbi:MAG: thiamine phosphate synthase [Planctomycetia bacterium]|jgi:thiamine-phosphate pyrophosphorylase